MKLSLRKAAIATATVAATGGLAFGATSAFASTPTSSASPTASSSAASHPNTKAGANARARHVKLRGDLRAHFNSGAHGQSVLKNKAGQWVEHEWQVGTVKSITGENLVVTDASGTTWTWTLTSGGKVRVDGKVGALSGVKTGDRIALEGVQSSGANDARLVLDPNQATLK
jgi:hypothetical protein